MKVGILNYGVGNVGAIASVYRDTDVEVIMVKEKHDMKNLKRIILPGVGSFDTAMNQLKCLELVSCLDDFVSNNENKILGICVGMQIMFMQSEEGLLPGLGWVSGKVLRLKRKNIKSGFGPLPHMGWEQVHIDKGSDLFKEMYENYFYFLHSYYVEPENRSIITSKTDYGIEFAASIQVDNLYGVQFHPEKSHGNGKELLLRFAGEL